MPAARCVYPDANKRHSIPGCPKVFGTNLVQVGPALFEYAWSEFLLYWKSYTNSSPIFATLICLLNLKFIILLGMNFSNQAGGTRSFLRNLGSILVVLVACSLQKYNTTSAAIHSVQLLLSRTCWRFDPDTESSVGCSARPELSFRAFVSSEMTSQWSAAYARRKCRKVPAMKASHLWECFSLAQGNVLLLLLSDHFVPFTCSGRQVCENMTPKIQYLPQDRDNSKPRTIQKKIQNVFFFLSFATLSREPTCQERKTPLQKLQNKFVHFANRQGHSFRFCHQVPTLSFMLVPHWHSQKHDKTHSSHDQNLLKGFYLKTNAVVFRCSETIKMDEIFGSGFPDQDQGPLRALCITWLEYGISGTKGFGVQSGTEQSTA